MKKLVINGGARLSGEINIAGSKNSVVALIPAAILCKDKVIIRNYPKISDVEALIKILKTLNVEVEVNDNYLCIDSSNIKNTSLINENMSKLRASYYFMGALLALFRQADVKMPGGCDIGERPIDLHIKGFKLLNTSVAIEEDVIHLKTDKLIGNEIFFDIASVGATINVMMAAVFADGITIIENAAREPEIADVADMLNEMGAKIEGAGSGLIKITGVNSLHGTDHTVIPDRIEAGTYIIFGAACADELIVNNVNPRHLQALISKLNYCNVNINSEKDKIIVKTSRKLHHADIRTAVYPGFPTDLQQIMTALLTQAEGTSNITETIYSSRFKNCEELIKMGAAITIDGCTAKIQGKSFLTGREVLANDLRGGASLVLAGLIAEGVTVIDKAEHIFRGYGNIVENLRKLNAEIRVIEEISESY